MVFVVAPVDHITKSLVKYPGDKLKLRTTLPLQRFGLEGEKLMVGVVLQGA